MITCINCGEFIWTETKDHKCKPKWFCLDADDFKQGEIPTPEEFYSFGAPVFAHTPTEAAIEYMKWRERRYSDYLDEMTVLVLEKEDKIYKYYVEGETTREYYINSTPEIFELKIDDTKGNPKLFEF